MHACRSTLEDPTDELRGAVDDLHRQGLSVAVHCVTRESLLLTLAVLDDVGRLPGDRIEHASVVPPGVAPRLRGLRVITQPGFLADRGDDYLRDVHRDDLPHLYRHATLLAAGVDVVASSDAPFGPVDPWAVIRAARDRVAGSGTVIGAAERVDARAALAGYLTDANAAPRSIRPGVAADLCLLEHGLDQSLTAPARELVRAVWFAGQPWWA